MNLNLLFFEGRFIVAISMFILLSCNRTRSDIDTYSNTFDFYKQAIIEQSDSLLISALPDSYRNFAAFNSVSDSFVIKTPDTSVTVSFSEKARDFLRDWQPEKGVFRGLNSEIEQGYGCCATLAYWSSTEMLDTIMFIATDLQPSKDLEVFDVSNPCDSWVAPVFERIPRFVYTNGKYERLKE